MNEYLLYNDHKNEE